MAFPNDRGCNLEREMEHVQQRLERRDQEFDRLLQVLQDKGLISFDDEAKILMDGVTEYPF